MVYMQIHRTGGIYTIYQRILSESKYIEQQIQLLEKQLDTLPEGKLICCHYPNSYKWYHSLENKKTYISKKNRQFAEELAQKKYLLLKLEELKKEQTAINFYLRHYQSQSAISGLQQFLEKHPGFAELLEPYFKPKSKELEHWINMPYETNPIHQEQLICKSISGNYVRSKSEAIIDMHLYLNKIPFRYEAALELGDTIIYPDFTICHPETMEIFYWEHFGLMDNSAYAKNAYSKLQLYNSHGITPSIHLITTYETKEHPLDIELVEKLITHYFL